MYGKPINFNHFTPI